jgi:hypothetical protein
LLIWGQLARRWQWLEAVAQMSWKFFLYDWGGLNIALFQAINMSTPAALEPLAWFFSLVGKYWTAPLMLLGSVGWSKSAQTRRVVRPFGIALFF